MNDAATIDRAPPSTGADTASNGGAMLPQDYIKLHPLIFASHESWRYFVRQHRAELVEAGALLAPTGKLLVAPAAFDRVLFDVGRRMAGTKLR